MPPSFVTPTFVGAVLLAHIHRERELQRRRPALVGKPQRRRLCAPNWQGFYLRNGWAPVQDLRSIL